MTNYRFSPDDSCIGDRSELYPTFNDHEWVHDTVVTRKVCCLCGLVRPFRVGGRKTYERQRPEGAPDWLELDMATQNEWRRMEIAEAVKP